MPSEQRIMDLLILVFFFFFSVFQIGRCFHFSEILLGVASTSFSLFFAILHESKQ
jgi:hypothetical protein